MATGETKLSYLDVVDDIQDGDTVPILRNGKNYMSTGLAQVNADLTDKAEVRFYSNSVTVESMLEDWLNNPNQRPISIAVYGECAQFLTNSSTTAIWFGLQMRNGVNCDYFLFAQNSNNIYWGRVVNGALTVLRSVTGSSISLTSVGDPVVMGDEESTD